MFACSVKWLVHCVNSGTWTRPLDKEVIDEWKSHMDHQWVYVLFYVVAIINVLGILEKKALVLFSINQIHKKPWKKVFQIQLESKRGSETIFQSRFSDLAWVFFSCSSYTLRNYNLRRHWQAMEWSLPITLFAVLRKLSDTFSTMSLFSSLLKFSSATECDVKAIDGSSLISSRCTRQQYKPAAKYSSFPVFFSISWSAEFPNS